MSKTLKRIFSAALVLCMLLAVLPATASAAFPATDAVVYDFSQPYNNGTAISSPTGVTAELYNAGSLYEDANSTKPLNWYFLNGSSTGASYLKFANSGIYSNVGPYHWNAMVIDVPAAGNYDVVIQIQANGSGDPGNVFTLIEVASNSAVTSVSGSAKNKFHSGTYTTALVATTDFTLRNTTGGNVGYAYLGNVPLNKGLYVFTMQKDKDASGSNQKTVQKLTLTPNSTSSFVDAINAYSGSTSNYSGTSTGRTVYQLCADVNAPAADLILANQTVDLRGFNLKVNSVSSISGGVYVPSGYTMGIRGEGSITANSVELQGSVSLQSKLAIATAPNTYKFTDVTTATPAALATREGAEEGTKSFGFDIGLIADAYGWDFSNVDVTLEASVVGEEITAVCDYSDEKANGKVTDWAAAKATADTSDDKVFYVDIKNYEAYAAEILTFRLTVSSAGTSFVTTVAYQNGAVYTA